jgi:hypothetical protein
LSKENNNFKIYFNLSNAEIIQSGVKYGVKLVEESTNGPVVIDEKIYPETLSLFENSVSSEIIDYSAPKNLSGLYSIFVEASNEKGFSYGSTYVGEVTLVAGEEQTKIIPNSCFVQILEEDNNPSHSINENVNIKPNENLQLTCLVINPSQQTLNVNPVFETYKYSSYGQVVTQTDVPTLVTNLAGHEEKMLSIILPKANTSQAYKVKVALSSETGISNPVIVSYTLGEDFANVSNAWLDKEQYKAGETAKLSFIWSPFIKNLSTSSEMSLSEVNFEAIINGVDGKKCTESVSQKVSDKLNSPKVEVGIPVTADCVNPVAVVILKDSNGKILDTLPSSLDEESVVDMPARDNSYQNSKNEILKLIVITLSFVFILILLIYYLRKRQGENGDDTNSNMTKTFIFAFLFIMAGSMIPSEAEAVTYCSKHSPGDIICIAVSFNLDKSNYTPSESIKVTAGLTASDMYKGSDTYTASYFEVQGKGEKSTGEVFLPYRWFHKGTYTGPASTVTNITAPSTNGSYCFMPKSMISMPWLALTPFTAWGYGPCVGFTVAPTALAPTSATINLSKSSVTETESLTVSWSGNNSPTYYRVKVNSTEYDMGAATSIFGAPSDLSLGVRDHNFYAMACNTAGCSLWSPVKVLTVTAVAPAPTLTFTASPTTVTSGGASTLTWSTTNATACTASGAWSGSKSTNSSQSTGALSSTQTYNLKCDGAGGSVTKSVTVSVSSVAPAPTLTFTASPTTVTPGGASTLTWSSTNVTTCIASGDWSGSKATGGSQSTGALSTVKTYTYTLRCIAPGGDITRSVTVSVSSVAPAPTLTFTASPTTVTPGGASTLTWSSTNVTTCIASGAWSGSKSTNSSQSTGALSSTQTYTLKCDGAGGSVTKSVTVTVSSVAPAPTLTFTASPTTVTPGGASTLTWSSTNVTTCIASGAWSGSKSTNSSQSTGALSSTQTYTLKCDGAGGSVTKSVTVTVSSVAPAPTLTFTASPTTVTPGGASTLTWSTTNATACTASGAWSGSKSTNSSQSTGALSSTQTYTLKCDGAGGSVTKSVTVSVSSLPPPPPPDIDISVLPSVIRSGETADVVIKVTTSLPTTCTHYGIQSSAGTLSHTGVPSLRTWNLTTEKLTNTKTIKVECTVDGTAVSSEATARINVIPSIEET